MTVGFRVPRLQGSKVPGFAVAVVAVVAGLAVTANHESSRAVAAVEAVEGQDTSTLDDQSELALTV